MTNKEKMLTGKLYIANDEELINDSIYCRGLLDEFNSTKHIDFEKRRELLSKLFGSVGKNANVNKPIYCDYGRNIYVGDNFYANFDCIFLDVCDIKIGNDVMFGPRVSVYTATHPIDKDVRAELLEYGKPITIGNNVWVGGSVTICPGVNIGDNAIIGAGSVVVKDIPANSIAAGNPCKVIRMITEEDKLYWNKKRKEYYND